MVGSSEDIRRGLRRQTLTVAGGRLGRDVGGGILDINLKHRYRLAGSKGGAEAGVGGRGASLRLSIICTAMVVVLIKVSILEKYIP